MNITKIRIYCRSYLLLLSLVAAVAVLDGCVARSVRFDDDTIAVVNGHRIDGDALARKMIQIHQFKSPGAPDKKRSGFDFQKIIDDMVNECLLIQEAKKLKLDEDAALMGQVESCVLNRSVARLRKEAIESKIEVTEAEEWDFFKTHYEEIRCRQIFSQSRNQIENILERLKNGEDFVALATNESEWGREKGGDMGYIRRGMMQSGFETVAFALEPGQYSPIVHTDAGYHIILLDKRKPLSKDMFQKVRKRVRKKLVKVKRSEQSAAYIETLRRKAAIQVNDNILESIDIESDGCDHDSVVARVDQRPITACDFVEELIRQRPRSQMGSESDRSAAAVQRKRDILRNLIDYELVNLEAIRHNYLKDPEFKKEIDEYKNNLLLIWYKQKVVSPQAVPRREDLQAYYEKHKDDFSGNYELRLAEMTFLSLEKAEEVLKELKTGADFDFLASKESQSSRRSGDKVWQPLFSFSKEVQAGIQSLEAGQFSQVIPIDRKYKIYKIKDKRGGGPEPFDRVKNWIAQVVAREKFAATMNDTIETLRQKSTIRINPEAVTRLTGKFP